MRRVAVTGMGIVSSLGNSVEAVAESLRSSALRPGRSAPRHATRACAAMSAAASTSTWTR
jgi:3-oxoacyl-(acyl-carrier-protein) synthase